MRVEGVRVLIEASFNSTRPKKLFEVKPPVKQKEIIAGYLSNITSLPLMETPQTNASLELFDDFDDILGSAVITSQAENIVDISSEKKFLGLQSAQTNAASMRRSTILNADSASSDGVIYSFRQLQEYKKNNRDAFDSAKEAIYMKARMAQDADGCGGINERGSTTNGLESGLGKITNLLDFKAGKGLKNGDHKEGKHDHCNNCGGDLTDGKCSKCAA